MRTQPHSFAPSRRRAATRTVGGPPLRLRPAVSVAGSRISAARKKQLFTARFYPLLFFSIYLLGSLFVFAFGPCQFEIQNATKLYVFLLAGQLAIICGYTLGSSYPGRAFNSVVPSNSVVRFVIVVSVCSLPITLSSRNFGQLSLTEALLDPGSAYAARMQEVTSRDNVSIASVLRAVLGPFFGLCVPCGIVFRNRLSVAWRWAWVAAVAALIVESLFVGAAKGMFDVVLIIPWFVWLYFFHSKDANRERSPRTAMHPHLKRGPWGRKLALAVITIGVLAGGLKYFAHSRQSRYGMAGDEYPPWTTGWSEPLYGVPLPPSAEYLVHMLSFYWTHGYVGLSECLELPFEWSCGVGHSTFLMRYAGQFIADPEYFFDRCYPIRLEKVTGYSATNHWHTIYPWLASDFTFPGAVLMIGVLAFVLARAWQDCLIGVNPFAIGVLSQMLLMFYYIPANNARLMFSEEIITFWGLIALWQLTRQVRVFR